MNDRRPLKGRVLIRFRRDQVIACACCGEIFNAGDEALVPREQAEACIAIGDAEMVDNNRRH